jgi:hypothetical protein
MVADIGEQLDAVDCYRIRARLCNRHRIRHPFQCGLSRDTTQTAIPATRRRGP